MLSGAHKCISRAPAPSVKGEECRGSLRLPKDVLDPGTSVLRNVTTLQIMTSNYAGAGSLKRLTKVFGALSVWGSIAKNGFQFEEFLEARFAPLAAVARLFVASETAGEIEPRAIDVNVARTNLL